MDAKGKRNMGRIVKREPAFESDDDEYEEEFVGYEENDDGRFKKKKSSNLGGGGGDGSVRKGSRSGGGGMRCCLVDSCTADLSDAKVYHRRHRVCEYHSKAQAVLVAGIGQRFCQQCSRFHELLEFDEYKRSCRSRLAGHNERRRKTSAESRGENSRREGEGSQLFKDMNCGHVNDRGRIKITIKGSSAYKHFKMDQMGFH